MEISYIFLKESFSDISGNGNPPKKFLIFQETELFYILGNGNPPKIPYISVNKTFLYFKKRKP